MGWTPVLIDDARTPLIISGPVPKGDDQLFEQLRPQVERLVMKHRRNLPQYLCRRQTPDSFKRQERTGTRILACTAATSAFAEEQGID